MHINFLYKLLFLLLLSILYLSCNDTNTVFSKGKQGLKRSNVDTVLVLQDKEKVIYNNEFEEKKIEEVNQDSFYVSKTAFNGKVQFLIPSSFSVMSETMKSIKYRNLKSSTVIYTNTATTVNLSFDITVHKASIEDFPEIKKVLEKQYKSYSGSLYKSELKKVNGNDMVQISFVSKAIDIDIFNIAFVTLVDGYMLMGTFNCTATERAFWEAKGYEIVNSMKIIDK